MITGLPLLPLVAVVAAATTTAGGLQVDTSTPDALCPDLGQVRQAAQARLGDIEAEGAWRATYALIHRPDRNEAGDVVRLELHDPMGRLRLRRDLPRAGESCASLAGALVVVLDSYFRHPVDATGAAPASGVAGDQQTLAAQRAPPAPPESRLALDLTGGWSGGWLGAEQSSPVLALGLRLALASRAWWGGVEGSWLLDAQSQQLGSSRATQHSYGVRAFFARDIARDLRGGRGSWTLLFGPEAVMVLNRADGAMLMDGVQGTRPAFGGGARLSLQVAIARPLRLGLLAIADYLPSAWQGGFSVGRGAETMEIFPATRLRLMIGAGLSWAVF